MPHKIFDLLQKPCENKWSHGGSFSANGMFEMDCPSGGTVSVYAPLTHGIDRFTTIKYIQFMQQPNNTLEFDYTGPMHIDVPGAYSLLAKCDGEEKLFVHVQKIQNLEAERKSMRKTNEKMFLFLSF